jgi:putative transposase
LIFDHDAKFGLDAITAVRAMGSRAVRTSFRSPWQNGVAERWVGSCRRDLLDHVIVRDERHLKRLLSEYVRHYHEDRTHLRLNKETPAGRVATSTDCEDRVRSTPRLGGLHHRYDLAA